MFVVVPAAAAAVAAAAAAADTSPSSCSFLLPMHARTCTCIQAKLDAAQVEPIK